MFNFITYFTMETPPPKTTPKTIAKPQEETAENIIDNILLDLTLSDIKAYGYQQPTITVYEVPEEEDTLDGRTAEEITATAFAEDEALTNALLDSDIIYQTLADGDLTKALPQVLPCFPAAPFVEAKDTSNDGVFATFWWAVTYVVNSLVENICNYLVEDSEHDKTMTYGEWKKCEEDISLQGYYPKIFDIFGY